MRTAEAWERLSGKRLGQFEMEAATSAHKGVATSTMVLWLYCSLVEGEELEGREFPYSLDGMKKVVKPSILTAFAPIFLACYIGESVISSEENAVKEQKKNKKTLKLLGFRFSFRLLWVLFVGLLMCISAAVLLTYLRH